MRTIGTEPVGSAVVVAFEGAGKSTARPGTPAEFEGPVSDPNLLDHPIYVRLLWTFYTDRSTQQPAEVEEIELEGERD